MIIFWSKFHSYIICDITEVFPVTFQYFRPLWSLVLLSNCRLIVALNCLLGVTAFPLQIKYSNDFCNKATEHNFGRNQAF